MKIYTRRLIKNLYRDEKGASAVEFAMVAPILILLVFAIIYCGLIFNEYLVMEHLAQEGVRQASLQRGEAMGNGDAIKTAIEAGAGSLDTTKLIITIDPYDDRPAGQPVTVRLEYPVVVEIPIISRLLESSSSWDANTSSLWLKTEAKMRIE